MSDKNKEKELDKNAQSPGNSKKVEFENNDNWEFEAKALTLENDAFEIDEEYAKIKKEKESYLSENSAKPTKAVQQDNTAVKTASRDALNLTKFLITGIIGVIIIAALVFLGIRYYTLPNTNEINNPGNIALTVGDCDISVGTYNYYYNQISNYYISAAQQGYDVGLDPTVDFSQQKTTDANGKEITWEQFFEDKTIENIQYRYAFYQEGVSKGVELTKAQKEEIDATVEDIKSAASESDMSVDNYAESNYGEYCGLLTYKKILEATAIAGNYLNQYVVENKADKKDIEAYVKEHKDEYTQVDLAYLFIAFDSSDENAKAETEKKAKEYAEKIKNIDDLKKLVPTVYKEYIDEYVEAGQFSDAEEGAVEMAKGVGASITKDDTSFTQEAADWLYDEKTKVNDCNYFYYNDGTNAIYFVILKTSEPYLIDDELYSVRHILVSPNKEKLYGTDELEFTDEEWAAAKKKADSILAEYKKGDKTEYSFALLAEKYSDDTESTSSGSQGLFGGLYEGVSIDENMNEAFKNWSIDKSRKYGDVGIVEVDYGYHIMFFIEDAPKYYYQCRLAVEVENAKKFTESFEIKKNASGMKNVTVAKPSSEDTESSLYGE